MATKTEPTSSRTVSMADLARLKQEREASDRAYNDALTSLDQAIQQLPPLPDPPPPPDVTQIDQINARWSLIPTHEPIFGRGLRARVKRFVWTLVAPALQQQHEFNSALIDHLNRNQPLTQSRYEVLRDILVTLRDQLGALNSFESRLIVYLQQITPYVDTKDREFDGMLRRINEDRAEAIAGLAGGIGGVSDEIQKRWESMEARERRYEAQVYEVRTTLGTLQQASLTLKREMERLLTSTRRTSPSESEPSPDTSSVSSALDSYKYVGFEDQFRGSTEQIRARLVEYVPLFRGRSDVLDVGCGRGEFLDLLREEGSAGRGLDINHEMVEVCRERGLEADEGDALGYLSALPDNSLGGLFAAQVVEHLEPDYLMRLLDTAYHKARPGSKIVLETINPTCWYFRC